MKKVYGAKLVFDSSASDVAAEEKSGLFVSILHIKHSFWEAFLFSLFLLILFQYCEFINLEAHVLKLKI